MFHKIYEKFYITLSVKDVFSGFSRWINFREKVRGKICDYVTTL